MTTRRLFSILRWALYALLFLLAMMLQTVVLARGIGGFFISCVPVAVACIAMQEGAEGGGAFALAAAVLWCLSGAAYGSAQIVTLTVAGVLCGGLCEVVLTKKLLPAAGLCAMTLLLCDGVCFLLRLYLGGASGADAVSYLLPSLGISLCFLPLFYVPAHFIAKIGRGPGA